MIGKPTALIAVAASLVLAGAALAAPGTGTLLGQEKRKLKGCESFKGALTLAVTLQSNNAVSLLIAGGPALMGTATAEKPRKLDVVLADASVNRLLTYLSAAESNLCGTAVQMTSVEFKQFLLKFNKKGDQARTKIKARTRGTADAEERKGSFKARAKGDWTPSS